MFSRHANSLRNGLTAYWRLNEPSGIALSHNAANNLTDNNTVTQGVGNGQMAFSRQFTAANVESFSMADNADVSPDTSPAFTVSAWMWMDTKSASQYVVGKYLNTSQPDREYALGYDLGTDRLSWGCMGASDIFIRANNIGIPVVARWYHLVGWYSKAAAQMGLKVNNAPSELLASVASINTTATAFLVGSIYTSVLPFNGKIMGVGIWKRLLTEAEMNYLYNNGRGRYVV